MLLQGKKGKWKKAQCTQRFDCFILNINLSLHFTFYRLNASQSYFQEVQGRI